MVVGVVDKWMGDEYCLVGRVEGILGLKRKYIDYCMYARVR